MGVDIQNIPVGFEECVCSLLMGVVIALNRILVRTILDCEYMLLRRLELGVSLRVQGLWLCALQSTSRGY